MPIKYKIDVLATLKEKGYTTVSGKISRKFYQEQFYGMADREAM